MKFTAYSRYDWLLQLFVLPLYISVLNWLLLGNAYWQSWATFSLATVISLIDSFFNWYVNNNIALKVNQLHPDPQEYVRRAFRRFLFCSISSMLHVLVLFLCTG